MVTSISLPFATLVTLALEPMGILGWAALNPSVVISCVAIPRWVNGCLCAMQKPVVINSPSIASITRLMSCLLPLPGQISGAKCALSLIIIHTKKNTRFFGVLLKKKPDSSGGQYQLLFRAGNRGFRQKKPGSCLLSRALCSG
jgi:hypothetical protein